MDISSEKRKTCLHIDKRASSKSFHLDLTFLHCSNVLKMWGLRICVH